jgi:hypothetical protein
MLRVKCLFSGDFSGDNLTLPRVPLNRDSLVSPVTHAYGVSELNAVVTLMSGGYVPKVAPHASLFSVYNGESRL